MSLSILVVMDALSTIKAYKDTTVEMMRALQKRGHVLFFCEANDVFVRNESVFAYAASIQVNDQDQNWFHSEVPSEKSLRDFKIILVRRDPPFDLNYLYLTHALGLAEKQGVFVANRPDALRSVNEKAFTLHFSEWIAPTVISSRRDVLLSFIAEHDHVVLKPLHAMGGESVFRLSKNDANVNALLDLMTHHGNTRVLVQQYIPEIKEGDKRILLVNGEPMEYALNRVPSENDWRGNLAQGAKGVAVPLTDRDRELARALSPELKKRGLYFVGLDVIGGYLTEINVTSPTGVREIKTQTGLNIADRFVEFLEGI